MIEALTQSWRRHRLLRLLLVALSVAALAQMLAVLLGQPDWWLGVAVFLLVGCGLLAFRPFWSVTNATTARQLDRTRPDFEQSTHLLLASAKVLGPLEILQRERLLSRWQNDPPTRPRLNSSWIGCTIFLLGACLLVTRFFPTLKTSRIDAPSKKEDAVAAKVGGSELRLNSALIQIAPPAYLRLAARETNDLNFLVEESSLVRWKLRFVGQVEEAWLVLSEQERLPLRAQADGSFLAEKNVDRSIIYAVEARVEGHTRQMETLFSIRVQPDRKPIVTLLAPTDRTQIDGAAQPMINVQVRAVDDHGISKTALVATVANGSGENIRFRERELPLSLVAGSDYQAVLDLPALGMVAGDELYFHAEAADNREPSPQIGRSDTAFISWPGPSSDPVTMSKGVTVSVLPVIYRSERQIILDTEKLLTEKAALAAPVFLKRSDKLGVDQHLLRLRYGQFLGEENETAGQRGSIVAGPVTFGNAPDVVKTFGHVHDVQDTASLYDRATKGGLENALAQMWEAERHLRIGEAEEALPFENEALRILKELDQNARIYVQKSGFEPPPLHEREDRLTGAGPEKSDQPFQKKLASGDAWEPLRDLVSAASISTRLTPELSANLDQAREFLSEKAAADPGKYLPVLQAMRQVRARGPGSEVTAQLAELSKALWQVLPAPQAQVSGPAEPESALTRALRRKGPNP